MSAIFNRRFPVQPFQIVNRAGNAVVPPFVTATNFSGNPIATVTFTASATATSTRTASVTASATFTANNAGIQIQPNTQVTISQEPDLAGNIFNQGQSITTASPVW